MIGTSGEERPRRGRRVAAALAVAAGTIWIAEDLARRCPVDFSHLAERIGSGVAASKAPRRILAVVAGDPDVARDLHASFEGATIDCVDVADGPPIPDHGRGARSVSPRQLVAGGDPYDLIVFAHSAHAVDDAMLRNAMFTRARTLLATDGVVAVVDGANDALGRTLLGPGAFRFPLHAQWQAVFGAGGLRPVDHTIRRGRVHYWILQRHRSLV